MPSQTASNTHPSTLKTALQTLLWFALLSSSLALASAVALSTLH